MLKKIFEKEGIHSALKNALEGGGSPPLADVGRRKTSLGFLLRGTL